MVSGSQAWRSPVLRQWKSPGFGRDGSGQHPRSLITERMAAQRLFFEHVEIDALHAAGRADETAVDDLGAEAECLEDLRALVGLQRRDAHLGHDLEHALGDALAVGGDDRVVVREVVRIEPPVAARLPQRIRTPGTG